MIREVKIYFQPTDCTRQARGKAVVLGGWPSPRRQLSMTRREESARCGGTREAQEGYPLWAWPAALECRASPSRESRLPRTERTAECANAQQERGKNPQFREKKLLTAQRPRTYTHPARPIKLLGPPHHTHNPPTGQAPVVYAARCHYSPGGNSLLVERLYNRL
jgi:hypothetical protein